MTNYPDDLDDETLERLAEMFPETANDLKLWKRCNEIGKHKSINIINNKKNKRFTMELKEAEKILKDDGYVIRYSDLEDKAVRQLEILVTLANLLADVVHYFTDPDNDYELVKLGAYGFEVKNRTNEAKAKIGLLFDKTEDKDIPRIGVEINGELVYTTTHNSAAGLFRMVNNLVG